MFKGALDTVIEPPSKKRLFDRRNAGSSGASANVLAEMAGYKDDRDRDDQITDDVERLLRQVAGTGR